MEKTMLVNLRHLNADERRSVIDITRAGPWGNPVVLGKPCPRCKAVHTRADDGVAALVCYGRLLLAKLCIPQFAASVRRIEGRRLGCYCAPARCHGDVLGEYVHGYSYRLSMMGYHDDHVPANAVDMAHRSGRDAVRLYVAWLDRRPKQLRLM